MSVKVTATKNGPYRVDGPIIIEDASGKTKSVAANESAWLCRCGKSGHKPFCDGTHKTSGFQAEQ